MIPERRRSLVSRGLFVSAALLAFVPGAFAQTAPSERDIINAIPEPRTELPTGLETRPEAKPETTATVPAAPAVPAAAAKFQLPDEAKNLSGRKLIEAPLANLSGPDAAIAEKLRELIALRGERYFTRKDERDAVEVFYRNRGFEPLWFSNGAASKRAEAAVNYIKTIDAEAMNPDDYAAPRFKLEAADQLAEEELKYTAELLRYARHAWNGRVHFSRVHREIEFKLETPDTGELLTKLANDANVAATLASFHPTHEQYRLLKQKLAEARGKTENAPTPVPNGPQLRFVAKAKKPVEDSRVPLLRQRLGLAAKNDEIYDAELADAVREFQKDNKIAASGVLGPQTIKVMNGEVRERDADIIAANMERWRWMGRDFGPVHVMVNIPDYTMAVVEDGKKVWGTRVIVGKTTRVTPITTQQMSFITINPTWNVPPSIIAQDYLPALRQDPGVLERMGLRVVRRPDGTIHVWQPPGDANALGRIRFNFPNKFLVYQHDTPGKHLFKTEMRAHSAGCIRVQDPDKYAEILLNYARPGENWTAAKVRSLYGKNEQNIKFERNIPVHLTYQTATVEDGKLVIRKDVYGRDAVLIKAMNTNGNERRVLDVAVQHRDPAPTRQSLRLERDRGYDRDRGPNFDFFSIFRFN
jgi:murein L,D-transpeptidase YcbB/YkuD